MAAGWVGAGLVGIAIAGAVGGTVLLTSGPLTGGDDRPDLAAQQTPVAGELARQLHPDGSATDAEKAKARDLALTSPEISGWLASHDGWNLLWVEPYDVTASKDSSCSPGPCVEVIFYSWNASRALTAVLNLNSGRPIGTPVELRAPRLTQQLKDEAIQLALADPVLQHAVGPTRTVSNVADFDGYGVCGKHLCALVAVVSPDKPALDRTNGAGVEVDLVTQKVVLLANHTGILKDERAVIASR